MRRFLPAFAVLALLCASTPSPGLGFSLGGGMATCFSSAHYSASYAGSAMENVSHFNSMASKVFFDATYFLLEIGLQIDHGSSPDTTTIATTPTFTGTATFVTIGGFVKYPFDLGPVLIFPLLGAQLGVNLSLNDAAGNDLKASLTPAQQLNVNELWLMGGVGVDILLGRFFIRPVALVGFKPLSSVDNNSLSAVRSLGLTSVSLSYLTLNAELLLGARF